MRRLMRPFGRRGRWRQGCNRFGGGALLPGGRRRGRGGQERGRQGPSGTAAHATSSATAFVALIVLIVCEAADFQRLGSLEKGVELLLGHIHLTIVHELEQGVEVLVSDVTQDDDRVLTRIVL